MKNTKFMKRTLKKAIETGDVFPARAVIVEQLTLHPRDKNVIENITYALENIPGLCEEDDNTPYRDVADLKRNFSREKLEMFVATAVGGPKVVTGPAEAPDHHDHPAPIEAEAIEVEASPLDSTCDATDDDSILTLAEAADRIEAEKEAAEKRSRKSGHNLLSLIGYNIIFVGIAMCVVALCVSLKILIGIGIAVIFIGAAISYFAIANSSK